ncbi:cysteine sulfinate desulfinase/cysteine desulfurase-like protein [Collimonas sp. PA-H2]|uniref:aminotransferase class V-fold PLP-dependent enzyme n=1 Tax=Collimonas sp. PA-H2 TaxID=1881062 RepID=UPI000BF72FE9|nr:aminotransferase class V-fold PLP-dependent enzyme [Collimonas sp. PA-H2]PFH10738.1 cysteine sulfinate desulfinase/cysteine desulfurase-like protein [Collimonas sp. PA-H2]
MIEIYLDANATTAVLPAAIEAAARTMKECFGNPSSSHATGIQAKTLMSQVRQRAARLLGVGAGRLMFNSGATEGIQTAVLSALCALRERQSAGQTIGRFLLYGATEHKAVPESLAHWNRLLGLHLELKKLPVDQHGQHDLAALRQLAGDAALVCTMAANNETGVISDLAQIEAVLQHSGSDAYWLVDCVQALGKMQLDLAATRIDYATFSGHKLYAPKGIGMLYVRPGAPFTPLIMGGGQESGLRSGTENMAGIAALGAVLGALENGVTFRSHQQLHGFSARLVASLRIAFPDIVFNQPLEKTLPTTLNFSVPGLASKELLDLFDAAQLRVSSGSACSAAKSAPSYVLEAMQLPHWRSSSAIRMSFGPLADDAFISAACARIEHCGLAWRQGAAASMPSAAADPVVRFNLEGANAWLVADDASRSCVIIDPSPLLAPRLASHVRNHGYQLRAILSTKAQPTQESALLELARTLGNDAGPDAGNDAFGWPAPGSSELVLGARKFLCKRQGEHQVYLLGSAGDEQFAPHFAFIGALPAAAIESTLIEPDTLLCPARDETSRLCTSLRAEQNPAHEESASGMHLEAAALEQFLAAHPGALLIDVREAYEQAAGMTSAPGQTVLHVPLSRLTSHLRLWLRGAPVPLVFFCRSGNRSDKAVACLRRLGYQNAWNLSGGLALGNPALSLDYPTAA